MDAPALADRINAAFGLVSGPLNSLVFTSIPLGGVDLPVVVLWLMAAAVVFTVRTGFVNVRGFARGLKLLVRKRDDDHPGEISAFQALSAALSGTVGLGNIVSVPIAVSLGGPGAVFWMILAGFFGMTSKFVECAMAVKHRRISDDGTVSGGPMYYIEDVFRRIGGPRFGPALGRGLGVFFAICCVGASVSILQVNQAHQQFETATGVSAPLAFGFVMAALVALVIIGGVKVIGRVASYLVPAMAAIYLVAGFVILAVNIDQLLPAFGLVFKSAFGLDAAAGGAVGAIINGVKRATYSNEAGVGSAAIAHSAVKTDNPLTEGYVALLEPFFDTVVVCTMTGLIVIVSGAYLAYEPGVVEGVQITSRAYASVIDWFPYLLSIAAILFAFSSLVTWAYYGAKATGYLFHENRRAEMAYKAVLCVVLGMGAAVELSAIIDFIDSMLFLMAFPNILALYFLLPELLRDVKAYEAGDPAQSPARA